MEIKKMKVKDLAFYPGNPRKMTAREYMRLKNSIKEFGVVQPLVVNKKNQVIGGNQRLKVLRELGVEEVECVIVDLPPEKEKALNLALNKISGGWDKELLKEFVANMERDLIELSGFNFSEIEKMYYTEEKPEMEFSEELLEEHNYIVLYFNNTMDWLTAMRVFNLKTVRLRDSEKYTNDNARQGIGRVINGSWVLQMLTKAKGEQNG